MNQDTSSDELRVLALDTASARGSIALLSGSEIIVTLSLDEGKPHSKMLFPAIDELLTEVGLDLARIDLFAVVTGPGSFTGLRVGVAAMSGLARAESKRLIGVTAFDAWALASGIIGELAVIIDAGRDHLYCGIRRVVSDQRVEALGQDEVIDRRDIGASIRGRRISSLIVASGMSEEDLKGAGLEGLNVSISSADPATAAGRLAAGRFIEGADSPPVPYYVKPADAETKAGAGK